MNCTYCGTRNEPEVHRCRRCGRLLFRPVVTMPNGLAKPPSVCTTQAGLHDRVAAHLDTARPGAAPSPALQRVIVRDLTPKVSVEARVQGKTGASRWEHAKPVRSPSCKASRWRSVEVRWSGGMPGGVENEPLRMGELPVTSTGQQREQPGRVTAPQLRGVLVAPLAQRLIALLVNLSLMACVAAVLIGVGVAIQGLGVLQHATGWLLPASAACLFVAYYGFWLLIGAETPGARWAGLQLVSWSGAPAKRRHRCIRALASLFSLAALGMGWFWILVDEHGLGWHDYLSQTLYSPRA